MTEAASAKTRMYSSSAERIQRANSHVLCELCAARCDAGAGTSLAAGNVAISRMRPNSADAEHSRGAKQPVTEAFGTERLESVSIYCSKAGKHRKSQRFLFSFLLGRLLRRNGLHGAVERDERGFILTGADLIRAGKPPRSGPSNASRWFAGGKCAGIFVAGDVRFRSIKRVASGVGEGANAVQFVHQYLGSV